MKFVTYNIQYGRGQDGRYDLARTAQAVAGADVIALQEVERFWQRSGMVDEPAELARLLPDYHWVFGANLDMDASVRDDAGRLVNRRRQFGNMILARAPILSSRNFPLPKRALMHQHSIQRGILEAVIDPFGGHPIRVYSTHLSHLCTATRLPQIDFILDVIARAPADGGAWCGRHPQPDDGWTEGEPPPMPRDLILAGDLNFAPGGPEYERFLGPMTQYGRACNREGLVDAWVAAGHDEDAGQSHDGDSTRIDHVFVSGSLYEAVEDAWIDSDAEASDHYPLWVELASPSAESAM